MAIFNDPPVPSMPTVARMYTREGIRRASVQPGAGVPLVQLHDAQASTGAWRQRAELRQAALDQVTRERDALLLAAHDAMRELRTVVPSRCYPAAIAALARLQSGIASLS